MGSVPESPWIQNSADNQIRFACNFQSCLGGLQEPPATGSAFQIRGCYIHMLYMWRSHIKYMDAGLMDDPMLLDPMLIQDPMPIRACRPLLAVSPHLSSWLAPILTSNIGKTLEAKTTENHNLIFCCC